MLNLVLTLFIVHVYKENKYRKVKKRLTVSKIFGNRIHTIQFVIQNVTHTVDLHWSRNYETMA